VPPRLSDSRLVLTPSSPTLFASPVVSRLVLSVAKDPLRAALSPAWRPAPRPPCALGALCAACAQESSVPARSIQTFAQTDTVSTHILLSVPSCSSSMFAAHSITLLACSTLSARRTSSATSASPPPPRTPTIPRTVACNCQGRQSRAPPLRQSAALFPSSTPLASDRSSSTALGPIKTSHGARGHHLGLC
jgi:hypothetical protein